MAPAAKLPRVFLTHPPAARRLSYGERALAELSSVSEVVLNEEERPLSAPELIERARGCPIIISDGSVPGEAVLFEGLPDLLAFQRCAVDIRNVDVAAASRAGVLVTQASRGFVPAVAEWILGGMIAAARHIVDYAHGYRAGREPAKVMGRQLAGSTLGVIGYGAIAERLCEIAQALGMRVLVSVPYRKVEPPLEQASLADLLQRSDFVVPLAVATDETEKLIGAPELAAMKRTAWLVNASRGNLIDEAALEAALDAREIAGAVLDVGRAPGQQPSPHLARRPDVIANPHIGGLTPEAVEHQAVETARQAAAILRGQVPAGAVNAEHAHRLRAARPSGTAG